MSIATARDPESLKRAVHRQLLREATAPGTRPELRARLSELLRSEAPLLPVLARDRLLDELVGEVDGLGPLEPLLADPEIQEIMLNGPGRAWVERAGELRRIPLDLDAEGIERVASRVIAPLGLRLDRSSPVVDARLADGSRLHAVLPPLAPDGPCVTIRKFGSRRLALADFGVGPDAQAALEVLVRAGWNLLVAGGTSTGKTTLLNALASAIPVDERVLTIEETAELRLDRPHVVRLEARPPNGEGAGAVTVRDLVRAALRMRPDRIVVGEVRGGEAFDLLQALNTGHDGSLATVHANGPDEALHRIETLALLAGVGLPLAAVRAQLRAAVDAVLFVTRRGGRRRVEVLAEVPRADDDRVRPLLARHDGELVPVAEPMRPARRSLSGRTACS